MGRSFDRPITNVSELQNDKDLKDTASVSNIYKITLTTPMFGGGYKAGRINKNQLVSASTIRGHLRFWWRATRGTAFETTYDLRKKERDIFGDTSVPSQVQIWVEQSVLSGKSRMCFPKYALYSAGRELEEAKKEAERTLGHTFVLHVNLKHKDLEKELNPALWAWINFGGIGSRTRRGCGSLYCSFFSPSEQKLDLQKISNWFEQKVEEYELELLPLGKNREWPTLSNRIKLRCHDEHVKRNWDEVIEAYRRFRRRAHEGMSPTKPGRSHWPEADTIRTITRRAHPKHKIRSPKNKPEKLIAFPRAQFGLPIIFEFKQTKEDQERKPFEKEPYKTTLVPFGKERMASPVILKTLAYNSPYKALGMIVILNQPPIQQLELQRNGNPMKWNFGLKEIAPQVKYETNPMQNKEGKVYPTAIEAFLDSEEVENFCGTTNFNKR